MQDLRTILSETKLAALRGGYNHDFMLKSDLEAIARVAPQYVGWNESIAATFYAKTAPVKPIDRERCLIAVITTSGPDISLAMHVYWGLMEGLGVEEITHVVALAGCYGGLPRSMFGIQTIHRALQALARTEDQDSIDSGAAVRALINEFVRA